MRRRRLLSNNNAFLTINECCRLGYFNLNNTNKTLTCVKDFPFDVDNILDLDSLYSNTEKSTSIILNNKMPSSEHIKILNVFNGKPLKGLTRQYVFRGFKVPNYDFHYNIDSSRELAEGYNYQSFSQGTLDESIFNESEFNNLTISINRGNISSLHRLGKGVKFKSVTFNMPSNALVRPHDMSGLFEDNTKLEIFPNNIDYRDCTNIGWLCQQCRKLTEIPSCRTVTNEYKRITNPENTTAPLKTVAAAFNQCSSLTKIGPVLNMKGVIPDSIQKLPLNMFNDSLNISDIRLKNVSLGEWNFCRNGWTGLPNIDDASLIYLFNNVENPETVLFENKKFNTVNKQYADSTSVATFNKLIRINGGTIRMSGFKGMMYYFHSADTSKEELSTSVLDNMAANNIVYRNVTALEEFPSTASIPIQGDANYVLISITINTSTPSVYDGLNSGNILRINDYNINDLVNDCRIIIPRTQAQVEGNPELNAAIVSASSKHVMCGLS